MVLQDKIIKEFCVTEKATVLAANLNQYVFEVALNANRIEIGKAIAALFNVKVKRVNILNRAGRIKRSRVARGRLGKTAAIKRAIVTLEPGEKIEIV